MSKYVYIPHRANIGVSNLLLSDTLTDGHDLLIMNSICSLHVKKNAKKLRVETRNSGGCLAEGTTGHARTHAHTSNYRPGDQFN